MSINLQTISTEDLLKELESRGYKATKIKTTKTTSAEKKELINPVNIIRDHNESELRKQLEQYELKELIKICRTYTPDANGTIYRSKKLEKVIDFIVERATKLSKVGQCFRSCTEDTRTS